MRPVLPATRRAVLHPHICMPPPIAWVPAFRSVNEAPFSCTWPVLLVYSAAEGAKEREQDTSSGNFCSVCSALQIVHISASGCSRMMPANDQAIQQRPCWPSGWSRCLHPAGARRADFKMPLLQAILSAGHGWRAAGPPAHPHPAAAPAAAAPAPAPPPRWAAPAAPGRPVGRGRGGGTAPGGAAAAHDLAQRVAC